MRTVTDLKKSVEGLTNWVTAAQFAGPDKTDISTTRKMLNRRVERGMVERRKRADGAWEYRLVGMEAPAETERPKTRVPEGRSYFAWLDLGADARPVLGGGV